MSILLDRMKWLTEQGKKYLENLESVSTQKDAISIYSRLLTDSVPVMQRLQEEKILDHELLEINMLIEQQEANQNEIHEKILNKFPLAITEIGLPPYLANIEFINK